MQRPRARLQHGRTSAGVTRNELLKPNLGYAPHGERNEPRLHRGLPARLRRRVGGAQACTAITRGSCAPA